MLYMKLKNIEGIALILKKSQVKWQQYHEK